MRLTASWLSCLLSSFLLGLYADVNEYIKPNQINLVAFDTSRPGGKERKSQIKAQTVSTYIAGKSELKRANKRSSSVGLMLLVAGGRGGAQLFKVSHMF